MIDEEAPGASKPIEDEPPPVLRTWPRVYAFTLLYLALVILAFYLFESIFRP